MAKNKQHAKSYNYATIGFALLFPGIALATLFGDSVVLRVIGLAMIIVSAALFGASMSTRKDGEKRKKG